MGVFPDELRVDRVASAPPAQATAWFPVTAALVVHFALRGRINAPRPAQQPHPLLVSAGASPAGTGFAAAHCDLLVVAGDTAEKIQAADNRLEGILDANGRTGQVATSPFANAIVRDGEGEAAEEYERLTRSINYEATTELAADIVGDTSAQLRDAGVWSPPADRGFSWWRHGLLSSIAGCERQE